MIPIIIILGTKVLGAVAVPVVVTALRLVMSIASVKMVFELPTAIVRILSRIALVRVIMSVTGTKVLGALVALTVAMELRPVLSIVNAKLMIDR